MNKVLPSSSIPTPIPLNKLQTGTIGIIDSTHTDPRFLARFFGMGFSPQAEVMMIQNFRIGPVIVYLHDTQITRSRKVATEILIRHKNGEDITP